MATTLNERVAEEVRVLLARRRMSATALGRRLGVSQTYIWRRLEGQTAFDLTDVERIAEVLEVSIFDLLPSLAGQRRDGTTGVINDRLSPLHRTATHTPAGRTAPHHATQPTGHTAPHPTRPQSPIPPTKRRPTPTGPAKHPIAA